MQTKKILWITNILIAILIIFLIYYLTTETKECITNPIRYGLENYFGESNQFMCRCSAFDKNVDILISKNNNNTIINFSDKFK